MSQPKNKFLLGYGIVTALGAGVLGFLWYSASSENDTVSAELKSKQDRISKLEMAPLFPNETNLTKKSAQVDSYVEEVDKLHNTLVAYQRPLNNDITPDAVSANLGKYKTQLESIAKGRNIAFPMPPQGIDLGLARYLGTSPKREATPQVDYVVDSVNVLLTDLFRAGISKLDSINCPERAYEKDDKPVIEKKEVKKAVVKKVAPKDAKVEKPKKEEVVLLDENKVFNRYPVHLTFTGSESAVQSFLNTISTVGEGGPFWVINSMRVDNEKKAGPPVEATFQATAITPAAGATPAPEGAKQEKIVMTDVKFILGNEKVTVTLDLDLVRFLDPSIASDATNK